MKVLLIVAMESELEGFTKKLECEVKLVNGIKVYEAKLNNVDLYIAKSEVGKVNSAVLTTALCMKLKPKYVLNAGIAGGLNPAVDYGDIVVSSKIIYHDFDLTPFGYKKGQFDEEFEYLTGCKKLLGLSENCKKGLIVSGDQFISGKEKCDEIKKDFPKALACDMEGCSIAHAATLMGRKFLIIRSISDNVYLPNHINEYQDHKYMAIDKVASFTIDLLCKL